MFTGIIETLGRVISFTPQQTGQGRAWRLEVEAPQVLDDVKHGDSIAVNGLCLTVIEHTDTRFAADVMQISVDLSTLSTLAPETRVNLERAARVGDRLGGHIVQGHIDGTATVTAVTDTGGQRTVRLSLSHELAPLIARKGSIAVDGVSLTVSAVSEPGEQNPWFEVSLIPETIAQTTLGMRLPGNAVNIETDIVARHVERMLSLEAK